MPSWSTRRKNLTPVCGELTVARVVERLDAHDPLRQIVMSLFDESPECDLGGPGSGDQDLADVGNGSCDVAEECDIVRRVSGTGLA